MEFNKYQVDVNGVDITDAIEIDSYQTSLDPVYGDSITTMDGIEHVNVLRYRGSLSFTLNPQTAKKTNEICAAFMTIPALVHYHCLQRGVDVYARMRLDGVSAQALARIRFGGTRWVDIGSVTLQEL